MKKFIAISLCFVLTASALTACRSKSPEETNSPTHSTTQPMTESTIPATMPTILPETDPTDATGNTEQRQGSNTIPMR